MVPAGQGGMMGRDMLKRTVDFFGALVLLLAVAPLLLAVAVAVAVSSPGPVLFRQTRVGRDGRPFTLLKFRTMVDGAETMLDQVRALNTADGPLFKVRDDPRVTAVGRRLRASSLDELPQLANVVRGDMSLVGPRPPLETEAAAFEGWQRARFEVRPGVTGLWQVSGRSGLSFADYVRFDLQYVRERSTTLDFWILARTVPTVLSGRGAC